MFRAFVLVAGLALPATLAAEEVWQPLDGDAIRAALSDRWLVYEGGAAQFFGAGGATTYGPSSSDQNSTGRWRVEGDRYCSVWPPSDLWACYDMAASADGVRLRFVAGDGSSTDGTYSPAP